MSIANEISRIQKAKTDLKNSISGRGAKVEESTLDLYAGLLDSCPYCVRGYFTPEEDTAVFSVQGITFYPECVTLFSTELYDLSVLAAVNLSTVIRNGRSIIRFRDPSGNMKHVNVLPTSEAISWSDDGCCVTMLNPESRGYFKGGYTYEYIIMGGAEG